jgi:ABC-type phosphonate transport system ATPase subunit
MPPLLEARALVKRLGGRLVVDGVDLVCHTGQVLGLLGPNGAGKTTTLSATDAGIVGHDPALRAVVISWSPRARRCGSLRTGAEDQVGHTCVYSGRSLIQLVRGTDERGTVRR